MDWGLSYNKKVKCTFCFVASWTDSYSKFLLVLNHDINYLIAQFFFAILCCHVLKIVKNVISKVTICII
jgi:hypothetical protein